ncbi:MAG: sugar phosphate nucleotidyltransferase [Patescibacteria group bacterium]|nr:sugar phosphate nucleotidyltransferase [Patescibacteria group bacterium]
MTRQRITITLKSELLKQLDQAIDGHTIRNRSHAVENILSQALAQKPVKALVLAGGKGVNFSYTPTEMPKGLLTINAKPLLEHTLEKLKTYGIVDVVISVGAGGQKVRDYFRNGSRWGLKISYLDQSGVRRGTAQTVRQAQGEFSNGTFLLIYGDVLADIDFSDLLEFHRSQQNLVCTMALTSVERVSMWGVARLVGSKIVEFEEKPKNPRTHSHLVNAGIYVAEPSLFKYISSDMTKLESEVLPRLAEENKLGGYTFDGLWYDVSTPQIYENAVQDWKSR